MVEPAAPPKIKPPPRRISQKKPANKASGDSTKPSSTKTQEQQTATKTETDKIVRTPDGVVASDSQAKAVAKPNKTKTKPPVMATFPITSDTKTQKTTDIDLTKELGLESSNQVSNTSSQTAKKTLPPTRIRRSKPAKPQPTKTVEKTPKTEVAPTTIASEPSSEPSTATRNVSKTKTSTPTTKTVKPAAPKVVKRNPLQLVIVNPKKIGYPVSFLAGDEQQTLQPGESFERILDTAKATAKINFDRGGSFGEAVLNLNPGSYRFTVTRKGWDVVPQDDSSK